MNDTDIIERRAIFCRIGNGNYIGRQFVRLDDTTTVWYNKRDDLPKLTDTLAEHAAHNDGKLLLPFDYQIGVKSVMFAAWFILYSTEGDYIIGRIHEAGDRYVEGMDDHDGYTVPKQAAWKQAKHWVKLDDVQGGRGFDLDDWSVISEPPYGEATVKSLRETFGESRSNCMSIFHN